MSQRQRDLRKEIQRSPNKGYKDKLAAERQSNSAALRIMFWILWTLKGYPLRKKYNMDIWYTDWIKRNCGLHIHDFLAQQLGLKEEEYKIKWYYGTDLAYTAPRLIYYHIYNWLFPQEYGGVFGRLGEDAVENDEWRSTFEGLINKEYEESFDITTYTIKSGMYE